MAFRGLPGFTQQLTFLDRPDESASISPAICGWALPLSPEREVHGAHEAETGPEVVEAQ